MCGFAVEGVPRKKTRCGLAGESGGGAGSAVEVENESLTRVNMSPGILYRACAARKASHRTDGRYPVLSHTLFTPTRRNEIAHT